MAKQADTGVYQLRNGNWAFRYTLTENGNKKDVRRSKNENGQKLRNMREAIVARDVAIRQAQSANKPKPILRRTVKEVFRSIVSAGGQTAPIRPNGNRTVYGKTISVRSSAKICQ